jgi:hypothetical protein
MKPENLESINNELFQALGLDEEELLVGTQCSQPYTTIAQWTCNRICLIDSYFCCVSDC